MRRIPLRWKAAILASLFVLVCQVPRLYARPATEAEGKVYRDAAAVMGSVGITIPPFELEVADRDDFPRLYAWAPQGAVVLSPRAAYDAQAWARVTAHTSRRGRRLSFDNCEEACLEAAAGAVHELVHVARWEVADLNNLDERWFEEGLAESVSQDIACAVVVRASGWRWCAGDQSLVYLDETARVRRLSADEVRAPWRSGAARRWRWAMVNGRRRVLE